MERDLLDAVALARLLGVTPKTVGRWARAGLIPSIRITPKSVRFSLEAVRCALLERGSAVSAGRL